MNLESTFTLQDLETLLTKGHCSCHFINPNKTRILLWKEVKDDQTTYHLRIGIQKFISQSCLDRNGETYWKFDLPEKSAELAEVNKKSELPTPELDPITKFQQRQAQAINHGKPNNTEPAINNSQSD